ncbi:hypothetical protein QN277_011883 [Acacia crassicarpa]|uniref:Retrotransposon Copia-like N-terminal domain-containing protein n=1 Tax=Acacia crassicarpa TaxID=499986 RepID=A0AAE1TD78_9FABA|nr:hypothetical protein QN277_011883 [Acacia crassicarpa]
MASNSDADASSATNKSPSLASPPSTTSPPIVDLASPFYIHPNENLKLILVSPPLDGPNYHNWARAMRSSLLSKNKL